MASGKCIIMGDFNRHVKSFADGFKKISDGYSWGQQNRESERIQRLVDSLDTIVVRTI